MKVDAISNGDLVEAADAARHAEESGFDAFMSAEVAHDPFLPLCLAAAVTERVDLMTGIAVAFARSPMNVAVTAADLHRLSNGRFVLGLGSQIKPHITKRFSMPWSHPAPRMREFIQATRAIWTSWDEGEPLQFRGEFYQHTLMTPMFAHAPSAHGQPRVFLAAVGPAMTAVAGEVADGLMAHGFTTADYFRDVTLTNLQRGLDAGGRTRDQIEVTVPVFTVTGRDEAEIVAGRRAMCSQIAFYGSTPAYRPVLEHHGWGELGDELNVLSKQGEWARMADVVDDPAIIDAFSIVGGTDEVAAEIIRRFGGLIDRVQIGITTSDPEGRAGMIEALRAA